MTANGFGFAVCSMFALRGGRNRVDSHVERGGCHGGRVKSTVATAGRFEGFETDYLTFPQYERFYSRILHDHVESLAPVASQNPIQSCPIKIVRGQTDEMAH